MRRLPIVFAATAALTGAGIASADLAPITTFGDNGWLKPSNLATVPYAYLSTGNTERGLSYNPVTGNVLLVSRQNVGGIDANIRILNPLTGADIGGLDVTTGVVPAGGTFKVNAIDVGADGAIYVGNLSTAANSNFKVYRWANESAPATLAYDGLTGLARTGDSFAATGSGSSTVLAAAGSNNVTASNFAVLATTDGLNYTSTAYTSVPGTSTATNDYRLGLTFVDNDTLIGNQGTNARVTDFAATANVVDSIPLGAAQRAIDYAVIDGIPFIAVIDSNSSLVQVLDITTPSAPILYDQLNLTSGLLAANGNGNGTGAVAWGAITGDSATLYAMNTNQGIQAFTFKVPEPTTLGALALAAGGLMLRRRQ